MKAIAMARHGGEEVLTYVPDFPEPTAGTGEVVVRVAATGLNQIDLVVRNGYPGIEIPLPHILGGDIVGTVEERGDGVEGVERGSRVVVYPLVACGTCPLCAEGTPNLCLNWKYFGLHLKGGYAQYVAVPAKNLLPLPDSVGFEEATALPVAGLTAYHALMTVARLRKGQTFFLWGGAGGLGTIAIELAKHVGATVIATASTEERLRVLRLLGADHVLNRLSDDVPAEVKKVAPVGVDLVLDFVGPETFSKSFAMAKKGGQILLCGIITGRETTISLHMTYLKHLSVKGLYLGTIDELRALLHLVATKRITPHIGARFDLGDAAKAHRLLATGGAPGKIALQVR